MGDSLAVEVRRQGAPKKPSSPPAKQAIAEDALQDDAVGQAAVAPRPVPSAAALGAAPGVRVDSVHSVHTNYNNTTNMSKRSNSISCPNSNYSVNSGNTSIVLL